MYNDLQGLGVDVAELKLKANTAIAFMDNFLVIDRSHCKTAAKERTVLAHEAGHYLSGAFYLAYSPKCWKMLVSAWMRYCKCAA